MIRLTLKTIFQSKIRIIYLLIIISSFFLLFLNIYENYELSDYKLFKNSYHEFVISGIKQIMPLIITIVVLILTIENDQDIYKLLIPYKSRRYIYIQKFISYLFIILIYFTMLFIYTYFLTNYLYPLFNLNFKDLSFFVNYLYDSIIITLISLMFVTKNKKMVTVFLILFFQILFIVQEKNSYKLLFYLIPVWSSFLTINKVMYIYMFIYLLFLVALYNLYLENRQISFK